MYSGHTPVNIAKLHAAIAVFDSKRDSFTGKVLIANSLNETAYTIRALGEWSHHNSEVRGGVYEGVYTHHTSWGRGV